MRLQQAWYLKEVSVSAQRVPSLSTNFAGSESVDMPAAIPCGPSKMCFAPVNPD